MSFKTSIKNILENNPINQNRIKKLRKSLLNKDVTFLTPNCLGGILFHDLGLRFMSPTVNMMMYQTDFVKFVMNLDKYLNGDFEFFKHSEFTCPCAHLKAFGLDDITVHFTHYADKDIAERKWRERAKRINKDNVFIFIEERDGLTKEDIESLSKLNVKGVVAFTCNKYDDIPYSVYLDKYHNDGEVGNILKENHVTGAREYENYFDFVKWFNEADGGNYDVKSFIK